MAGKSGENTVQCLERALTILECIVDSGEIGVSELSQKVGLHVATVHNILRTLSSRQYLLNISGRYQPGPALAVMLARGASLTMLARLAQPVLAQVAEETKESASMSVLIGSQAKLVAFEPGKHMVTIHYPQWVWDDALQLATGRILVAFASPERRQECIKKHQVHKKTSEEWEAEFEQIRKTMIAEAMSSNDADQYAYAHAILGPGNNVIAAMGSSCPMFRAGDDVREAMRLSVDRAAANLTAVLTGAARK